MAEAALRFDEGGFDVTGDQDDGRRVRPGFGHSRERVRCPRSSGGDRYPRTTGGTCIAIRRESGRLLVTNDDMLDLGRVAQRVIQRQIVHARHAKHGPDTLGPERRYDCLTTGHPAHAYRPATMRVEGTAAYTPEPAVTAAGSAGYHGFQNLASNST